MSLMSTTAGFPPYPKVSGVRGRKIKVALLPQDGDSKMKCSTCGMAEDSNPAHGSDYSGPGKHGFKGASKSLTYDNTPISFGGELKALGSGKIGGWAVLFSDSSNPDLTNDYFDSETDFFFEGETKAIRPVMYDHGLDPTIKSRKLARGTVEIKDAGLWFETQLNLSNEYDAYIYQLAERKALGVSTGSAPHLIQRESVGKASHMKAWPIVEISPTPIPIEPKTKGTVIALKSYMEIDRPDLFADFKGVVEEVIEDDRGPHEFEPSDDDPGECAECGLSLSDGNHASKKALEYLDALKGGPGSGRRAGGGAKEKDAGVKLGKADQKFVAEAAQIPDHMMQDITGDESKSEIASMVDSVIFDGSYSIAQSIGDTYGMGKGQEPLSTRGTNVLNAVHSELTSQFNAIRDFMKEGNKSLRPIKSAFDEELAEQTPSIYRLDSARDNVLNDIVQAALLTDITEVPIDLRQKITQLGTEYIARWIMFAVTQAQDYVDNGGPDENMSSPCGSGSQRFYLRSFSDDAFESFLSIKSVGGVRPPLNEHSDMAVSALEEYAMKSESLLKAIKSWEERFEKKIQFRAGDSTKSGRTISAATMKKLQDAKSKLTEHLAAGGDLNTHLDNIMALAEPKKSINLQLMAELAFAEQANFEAGIPTSVH